VPEISRFFGIIILMYYNDHPPPIFTFAMPSSGRSSRSSRSPSWRGNCRRGSWG